MGPEILCLAGLVAMAVMAHVAVEAELIALSQQIVVAALGTMGSPEAQDAELAVIAQEMGAAEV